MWSGFFLNEEIICEMNIFEIFHKTEYDTMPVMIHNTGKIPLAEFKKYVLSACEYLNKLPFEKSKNAVILSENTFDFAIWFFACVCTGREIFLCGDAAKLHYLEFEFIKLDDFNKETVLKFANSSGSFSFKKIDVSDVFVNFYTSGSSGKPKRIRKTLENTVKEAEVIFNFFKNSFADSSRVVSSASPQHMFAFAFYFMLSLAASGELILDADDLFYPDTADLKDCIFVSTPSFLEKFKKYEIPCVANVVFSAGAALNKELAAYLEKNSYVIDIYGSTETGAVAYKDSSGVCRLTALPEVKISTDSASQICVESPFFMENSFTLCDIIKMEDEKHFTLMNRSDRILKIQEKRISAVEIEALIAECEFVKECYCLKSFDKLACAVVLDNQKLSGFLPTDDNSGIVKQLTTYLKNYLASKTEIVPQRWRFLHELPKNIRGKIDSEKIHRIFYTNLSLPFITGYKAESDYAEYEMYFAKSCNFFEGHFTGMPVLPGVVQLYYANYYAAEAFGVKIKTDCVKKIKFSKLIKPDEPLKLIFERKNNIINYRYERDGQICSGGVMSTDEKD